MPQKRSSPPPPPPLKLWLNYRRARLLRRNGFLMLTLSSSVVGPVVVGRLAYVLTEASFSFAIITYLRPSYTSPRMYMVQVSVISQSRFYLTRTFHGIRRLLSK